MYPQYAYLALPTRPDQHVCTCLGLGLGLEGLAFVLLYPSLSCPLSLARA